MFTYKLIRNKRKGGLEGVSEMCEQICNKNYKNKK